MINGHGDDAYLFKKNITANFSSNVWYGGLDAGLAAHLREKITAIDHYPEAGAEGLQHTIAAFHNLAAEAVLVTNGATEAIYLIAQAFHGQTATVLIPAFAEYEDACRLQHIAIQRMHWNELKEDTRFSTALVFICNPNNPTGSCISLPVLQRIIQNNPGCCFVIDEAYIHFSTGTTSVLTENTVMNNCIVIRSLTKTCCIPGLRLGFIVSSPERMSPIRSFRMPWSVNSLAMEAGYYVYRNPENFIIPLQRLREETTTLQQQLQITTGWKIHPSTTHYFLFETGDGITATALKQYLMKEHGILIRDASNFRGLTPHSCRIACQLPEHNQLLIQAIAQCSQTGI